MDATGVAFNMTSTPSKAETEVQRFADAVPPNFTHWFVAEQAIGGVLLMAVILTVILSRTLVRTGTWLNMLVCWVISVLSYTLLSFAGRQTGPQPELGLCMFQATLTYGAPALCAFSALSLTIQVWFDISPPTKSFWYLHRTIILICIPYLVYIVTMIEALLMALYNREVVVRGAYCVVKNGIPGLITAILVVLAAFIGIVFQVLIGRTIMRARRVAHRTGSAGPSLSILIRMSIASLIILSTIVLSVEFARTDDFSQISNAAIGAMPVVTFLIFGTNRDIFAVWVFWKKYPRTVVLNFDASSGKEDALP